MGKLGLILTLVIFVSMVDLASAELIYYCTDSDVTDEYPDGINIYENGEIRFWTSMTNLEISSGSYTYDECYDGGLYERYCEEDKTIGLEIIQCPSGYKCWYDKCIEEEEEYTADIVGAGESPSSGGGGGSTTEYYTCPDGTLVEYCELITVVQEPVCEETTGVSGAGPGCTGGSMTSSYVCNDNPISLCPETETNNNNDNGDNDDDNGEDTDSNQEDGSDQNEEINVEVINLSGDDETGNNQKESNIFKRVWSWFGGLFGKNT